MARYEHLPIYKKALDVAVYFEQTVAGFSRYHKYTLGSEMRTKSREIVQRIIRANASRERQADLLALRAALEELLLLLRIGKEVKAFQSFRSYQHAAEAVVSVSRQNEGWLRSCGAARGPESPNGKGMPLPLGERA